MRRTKILATVGPATDRPGVLASLVRAGVDAFRVNLSHGTAEEHHNTVRRLRATTAPDGKDVALVIDVPGPKLRIGPLASGSVALSTGQRWALDTDPEPGNERRVRLELPRFRGAARAGDPILLGDGSVELVVLSTTVERIETRVVTGGLVRSQVGAYLPRARLRAGAFEASDRAKARVLLPEGVDFLAVSFVRDAADLVAARRWLDKLPGGREVGLIAKIERAEALRSIGGILEEADGIMVARGDLGIEVPLERLALEQKMLVQRANAAGRFVIVATQMLLSMMDSPRPTRAEATDVANAVLDGADAVMLSEESAVGRFPVEAVRWLDRIAEVTEAAFDPRPVREAIRRHAAESDSLLERSVAEAAVGLAESSHARAIVTPTISGRTARWVAGLRPSCPVYALSRFPATRRRLALVRGVVARPAPMHARLTELRRQAADLVRDEPLAGPGPVVLTAGYPLEGRATNLITLVDPEESRA